MWPSRHATIQTPVHPFIPRCALLAGHRCTRKSTLVTKKVKLVYCSECCRRSRKLSSHPSAQESRETSANIEWVFTAICVTRNGWWAGSTGCRASNLIHGVKFNNDNFKRMLICQRFSRQDQYIRKTLWGALELLYFAFHFIFGYQNDPYHCPFHGVRPCGNKLCIGCSVGPF